MSFANIYMAIPTWAIALLALIACALALRFRAAVAIGATLICLLGLWQAGDPHPWIAFLIGMVIYGALSGIATCFVGGAGADDDTPGRGFDHAGEQDRLAREHHRREREARF